MSYKQDDQRRKRKQLAVVIIGVIGLLIVSSCLYLYIIQPKQAIENKIRTPQHTSMTEDNGFKAPFNNDSNSGTISPSLNHDNSIPIAKNNLAPVISRLETKEPVVFLGIDDGVYKNPLEVQLMKDNNIKASLFLTHKFIKDNITFFNNFVSNGSTIEDHTLDHKLLSNLSYEAQKQEICGQADLEEMEYGVRPVLFRPPGGDYNLDTQRAAFDCHMKAIVMWDAKANGGSMQYQVGHSLHPGDIVLMHFRPEFNKDMMAFISAEKASGLHTESLLDWSQ
ncbi:MAG: polysaccharide deacetylase family protein [Candidatus Saccharimonadales bacterium]